MKTGNATSRKTSLTSRVAGNRGVANTGGARSGASHSSSPPSDLRVARSAETGGGRGSSARTREGVKRTQK
jgi:hypothetical protein